MAGNDSVARRLKHQRRLASCALVVGGTVAGMLFFLGDVVGLRVNFTPSEPIGLWQVVPLSRPLSVGDIVFICPPDTPTMREARSRGYLRFGKCPNGYAPLIKSIVALQGQLVTTVGEIRVEGIAVPSSKIAKVDSEGRPLPHYRGGVVPFGTIFLYSGKAGSYDSRYFGPLPVLGVLGKARGTR